MFIIILYNLFWLPIYDLFYGFSLIVAEDKVATDHLFKSPN